MARRFQGAIESTEAWPIPIQTLSGDDTSYNFSASALEGALFRVQFGITFNRLHLVSGSGWNPAGTGRMRVCIYQAPSGVLSTVMAKIFDEVVAGGDAAAASVFEVTPGAPVVLEAGYYILGCGLDTTLGGTLTPWLNSKITNSMSGENNANITGIPTTFTSLGAGSSATPPATIDPTGLTGGGGDDLVISHKFRTV